MAADFNETIDSDIYKQYCGYYKRNVHSNDWMVFSIGCTWMVIIIKAFINTALPRNCSLI